MSFNVDPKILNSIPTSILETIPGGIPTEGVIPNYENPQTRVPVILGVGIAFLVFASVCFSIRIYTKLVIVKSWKWDDITCSLGFMFSLVYFAVVVNGCLYGSAGRHQWDLHLDKVLGKYSLIQSYVTTIMVTPALGLIKSSLFIQYYLLFRPLRWIRICVWIGATVAATFYGAVSITAFVLESPWGGESLLETILSDHYLKFAEFSIPTGVIGMVIDWYLFILPIPAVLALNMTLRMKLGVLFIFMTGGLAALASILSLYYRVQLQRNTLDDPTWKIGYILLWAQVEMFAGVAASSMPTVHKFFSRHKLSLTPFKLPLKSALSNLLRFSSKSERLSDKNQKNQSNAVWAGKACQTAQVNAGDAPNHQREITMHNLQRNRASSYGGDSQIHITNSYSVS